LINAIAVKVIATLKLILGLRHLSFESKACKKMFEICMLDPTAVLSFGIGGIMERGV